MVVFEVGSDVTITRFMVHESVLSKSIVLVSELQKLRMNSKIEAVILKDDDPVVFRKLLQWLHDSIVPGVPAYDGATKFTTEQESAITKKIENIISQLADECENCSDYPPSKSIGLDDIFRNLPKRYNTRSSLQKAIKEQEVKFIRECGRDSFPGKVSIRIRQEMFRTLDAILLQIQASDLSPQSQVRKDDYSFNSFKEKEVYELVALAEKYKVTELADAAMDLIITHSQYNNHLPSLSTAVFDYHKGHPSCRNSKLRLYLARSVVYSLLNETNMYGVDIALKTANAVKEPNNGLLYDIFRLFKSKIVQQQSPNNAPLSDYHQSVYTEISSGNEKKRKMSNKAKVEADLDPNGTGDSDETKHDNMLWGFTRLG
jgi:hypothetical protein